MGTTDQRIQLIGYVRVTNRDELHSSDQDSHIHQFAQKEGYEVKHVEQEVSNGNQLMRIGVWKALRWLACTKCPPRPMPMADMYDYWFKEAMKPCLCDSPKPADGLIAENIEVLCTTPAQGAKFVLDMCVMRKHLFVSSDRKCLSCCNPQAIKIATKGKML